MQLCILCVNVGIYIMQLYGANKSILIVLIYILEYSIKNTRFMCIHIYIYIVQDIDYTSENDSMHANVANGQIRYFYGFPSDLRTGAAQPLGERGGRLGPQI